MKIFSAAKGDQALDRPKALNCAILNQLATPGLGTVLAGRIGAGVCQLGLSIIGFGLVSIWFIRLLVLTYRQIQDDGPAQTMWHWTIVVGATSFVAAWFWALASSMAMLRETSRR